MEKPILPGPSTPWHTLETQEVAAQLGVNPAAGLDDSDVQRKLEQHGPNELAEQGLRSPLRILWGQFTETLVLVLIAAAVLSGAMGQIKDSLAIGAIVILFGVLGFFQEYRAERAMAALKRMAAPSVRVRRGGAVRAISSRELVPGDVVVLEAGNVVPADARVIESVNLRMQEAALTGESEAIEKTTQKLEGAELALGDRKNLAYLGTVVTYGRGTAIVVQTGMSTELGRVATLLSAVSSGPTPLQRRLDRVGKGLTVLGVAVAALVSGIGLLRGEPLREMLMMAVSIAVAVVPEGLPAVVTITLALGAQRMLRRQALIRRLPAVESLGSVTVICSDKTGTLTENRMTVVAVDVAGRRTQLGKADIEDLPQAGRLTLAGAALCNDAMHAGEGGGAEAMGDPTEIALLVAARRAGLAKNELESRWPRVGELPFDSDRKRMTTVHERAEMNDSLDSALGDARFVSFTKGAIDGLLPMVSRVWIDGRLEPLNDSLESRIRAANDELAREGMRVLGVAFKTLAPGTPTDSDLERDLVFVGLVAMIDPARPEVQEAVALCETAGIRPVMITGDHPLTARKIARDLGISDDGGVLTGPELASLDTEALSEAVARTSIYARVSPEHKLRIVEALQKRGEVVAMTGDGVNDAPALKRADIGVAMGITGTDVAKEASDVVLRDDNFATIVAAVHEGRTIYDNLRKFLKYSVAGNVGKVLVLLLAPLFALPIPFTPLQLLWLNLLTDGLLGLGLGIEPPERDVMRRPPYSPSSGVFSDGGAWQVGWVGVLIGCLSLGMGVYAFSVAPDGHWQTQIFTTLAFAQVAQALAARSSTDSLFTLGFRSNPVGSSIAVVTVLLQLCVIYVGPLQEFFRTQALSVAELLQCAGIAAIVFVAMEVDKLLKRRRAAQRPQSRRFAPPQSSIATR